MEEKRLESAPLSQGHNEEHLQLMSSIAGVVEEALISQANGSSMSENILSMNNLFKEKIAQEDEAIIVLRKNELTNPIAGADRERDTINSGFKFYVRAYANSLEVEKEEAARRIQVLIDNYGDLSRRSYNKQSEATRNFLQDIDRYNASDIETIDAGWWIEQLEKKNNNVIELMDDRFSLNATRATEAVREIRVEIDRIYYQIAAMLEAGYILSEGASYGSIIDHINERLRYYKTTLAQRKGRGDAKKDKEESEDNPGDDGGEDIVFN